MSLTPKRLSPPVKGVNSTTPLREMTVDYAVTLDNMWLDQGQYITLRPCQQLTANSPTVPSTRADSIEHLLEHVNNDGTQEVFAAVNVSGVYKVYKWSPSNTWSASVATFSARPRSAELGGITVLADGASTSMKYNKTTGWTAVTSMPLGVTYLGNIMHTHKARMCNAGVSNQAGYVYFSDVITDSVYTGTAGGADDWAPASGGEFIDAGAAIGGSDTITGLTSYKGYLVVFMKNHIVFYSGEDPAIDFAVAKVIRGIGCVSHDSIKGIGNDTIFLSQFGFKSLEQIMVQGDAAAKQSSVPINNKVVTTLESTNVNTIRAEFIEEFGVYVCNMNNISFVYHVFFDSWTYWYDIQPQMLKRLNGKVITADVYMYYLDKNYKFDKRVLADGTQTGTTNTVTLIDSTAIFTISGINVGDVIANTTDGSTATIISIDSDTQLTTSTLLGGTLNTWTAGDAYVVETEVAVTAVWETPPIRAVDGERRARWNKLEVLYEVESNDNMTIRSYVDVQPTLSHTDNLVLEAIEPVDAAAGTVMVWSDGSGLPPADTRQYWGITNGNIWGGSLPLYSGSARLPLIGRGEFMSIRMTMNSKTAFRITALEIYFNAGGLR